MRGAGLAHVSSVLRLELLRLARDRRAFVLSVILPMALFPLLFLGLDRIGRRATESVQSKSLRVAADLEALPLGVHDFVLRTLNEPGLDLVLVERADLDPGASAALLADDRDPFAAVLLAAASEEGAPPIEVAFDASRPDGREAARRIQTALEELRATLSLERVTDRLEIDPAGAFVLSPADLASDVDRAGRGLGALLPLILCMVLVSGASYAALGAFCEEREGGTVETLLVQPVSTRVLALGKAGAVLVAALSALVGNGASFLACVSLGLAEGRGLEAGFGLGRLALALALFLPTAIALTAILCFVAARARSFREGQHYVLPVLLFASLLAAPSTQDTLVTDGVLALVPITGPTLVLRDALSGTLEARPALLAAVSSLALALLLLRHISSALDPERLFRGREHRPGDEAGRALRLAFGSVFVVYAVGGALQARALVPGLLATLFGFLALPALLHGRGMARRFGASTVRVLGLGRPRTSHLLGALLLAPALATFSHELFELQRSLLPLPSGMESGELTEALGSLSPLALVLLFALAPGICEELFFRGAVLAGLRRDLAPTRVVLWQALLFGAVHASLYRFLPTAVIGGLLAMLALSSRRLWPSILLHTGYNAILVLDLMESGAWKAAPVAVPWILAFVGVALLVLVPPPGGRRPHTTKGTLRARGAAKSAS